MSIKERTQWLILHDYRETTGRLSIFINLRYLHFIERIYIPLHAGIEITKKT